MNRYVLPLSACVIFVACIEKSEHVAAKPLPSPAPAAPAPTATPTPSSSTSLPANSKSKIMTTNQLTWTVSKIGNKLHISYRYENTGKTVVYVNDGAIQQVKEHLWTPLKTQFVTVTGTDTALLTVGVPIGTGTFPTPGLYVPVAPGKSFESSRDVEAPLEFEGSDGRWQPLPKTVTKLALAIELFEGEPPKWVEVKTATGSAKFPERPAVRTVQAEAKPLP